MSNATNITTEADDDKAYIVATNKGKIPANESKECTWCAKHHSKANKGHSWNE